MKKILFNLLMLLAFGLPTKAQIVSVADVEAVPGETVSFSVSISDGVANKYTALTLYVYFPKTGFKTTGECEVSSEYFAGASPTVGNVDENGLAIVSISGSTLEGITAADVENLVTIYFTVDESVEPGDYTVTLKKTLFEWGTIGESYVAPDASFTVKVVNRHVVTLDEESTTAPTAATDVDVIVKRTISANTWSTICLPFVMSENQVKSAFGEDVQLGDFTSYETTEDANENITNIDVKFESVTAIDANHPYIIKVSSAISEFAVEGVNIEPEEEPCVEYDNGKTGTKRDVYGTFIGTYTAETVVPENCLFLSDNKFFYSTGRTSMLAFRGYFDFEDKLASLSSSNSIQMRIGDNTESISDIENDKQQEQTSVIDLLGRRVKNLEQGFYIVNEKKVFIK